MSIEILIGDAIERLREMPSDSVHCVAIARYGRTTRPRPQRAIAMTVLFVVAIPTA